ncbi:hypothetical protein ACNKHQ_17925 [Shigella flexneri]
MTLLAKTQKPAWCLLMNRHGGCVQPSDVETNLPDALDRSEFERLTTRSPA